MSENSVTHPLRPKTLYCRLRPLLKWTGWSKEDVRNLEALGELKPKRIEQQKKQQSPSRRRKGKVGQRYYLVAEVDKIIGSN